MARLTPTDTELSILQVLWTRGPSTVREVHKALGRGETMAYTSVLKMLQIMLEKGQVVRDTSKRAHVYEATVEETHVQRTLVEELMARAFEGSARKLILSALDAEQTSSEDFTEIKKLLHDAEREV